METDVEAGGRGAGGESLTSDSRNEKTGNCANLPTVYF